MRILALAHFELFTHLMVSVLLSPTLMLSPKRSFLLQHLLVDQQKASPHY